MLHNFAFPKTTTAPTAMSPTHPRWPDFLARLRTYPGRCQHELEHSFATLAAMGELGGLGFLKQCQDHDVHCDCELVTRFGASADGEDGTGAAPTRDRQCPEAILRTLTTQLQALRTAVTDPSEVAGADVTLGVYPERAREDADLMQTQQALAVALQDTIARATEARARARTLAASAPGTLMNPDHPRWAEFIAQLNGPAGLDGAECQCDYRYSERILRAMGGINIPASLAYFDTHFGCCDCEVLCNMGESLLLAWANPEGEDPADAHDLPRCA